MQNVQNTALQPLFQTSQIEGDEVSGVIAIEPLDQGYGHTLGNALRRVLLSSLPGAAITKVRIDGSDHQYSTIDGVTEDVLEILLNLKLVRVRATGAETTGILKLDASKAGEVTAASIVCSAGFEVVNPDLHIATLAKGKKLSMEMTVATGVGYVLADESQSAGIGEVVIDALYSPIVRVSYTVEATRVGRRTDYDRLVMSIDTDGTISPLDAVQYAARVLARQFTQVFNPAVIEEEQPSDDLSPEEAEVLRLTVEELDLPTRIANALRKGGFATVGSLSGAPKDVVAKVKNLGEKSVVVINKALAKKGVSLGE